VVSIVATPPQESVANPSQIIRVGRRQDQPTAGNQVPTCELEQGLGATKVLDDLSRYDDVERSVDRLSGDVADPYVEPGTAKRLDPLFHGVDAEALDGSASQLAMQSLTTVSKVIGDADVQQAFSTDQVAEVFGPSCHWLRSGGPHVPLAP
jgi:hypothetical protein